MVYILYIGLHKYQTIRKTQIYQTLLGKSVVEPNNPATFCLGGTGTEMHSGSGSDSGSGFGPRSNIKRKSKKLKSYKATILID